MTSEKVSYFSWSSLWSRDCHICGAFSCHTSKYTSWENYYNFTVQCRMWAILKCSNEEIINFNRFTNSVIVFNKIEFEFLTWWGDFGHMQWKWIMMMIFDTVKTISTSEVEIQLIQFHWDFAFSGTHTRIFTFDEEIQFWQKESPWISSHMRFILYIVNLMTQYS